MASTMPVPETLDRLDMYIDGALVAPASGEYFESFDPFTARPWALVARGNAEDADRAVQTRPRDREAHRGAARRTDRGRERPGPGHRVQLQAAGARSRRPCVRRLMTGNAYHLSPSGASSPIELSSSPATSRGARPAASGNGVSNS